jgi:hypothetical protein
VDRTAADIENRSTIDAADKAYRPIRKRILTAHFIHLSAKSILCDKLVLKSRVLQNYIGDVFGGKSLCFGCIL